MKHVLCVNNRGYPASLELYKVYRTIPDRRADEVDMVRVVDESGEDYLFPAKYFVHLAVPPAVAKLLKRGRVAKERSRRRRGEPSRATAPHVAPAGM